MITARVSLTAESVEKVTFPLLTGAKRGVKVSGYRVCLGQFSTSSIAVEETMHSSRNSVPTILAVDDSPVMLELIKRTLEGDYRIIGADNAVDALSMIYHEKIAGLLLDVSMPGIDGLELCRTVRNLPQFQDLPIIMLTARDGLFDKVQGRLAGATEYLTKPFDAEQLRQVAGKFFSPCEAEEMKGKESDLAS